jgi:hypothetical protein
MYRLGSYKGVTGVFLRFFEMFFREHALSRQNKALKDFYISLYLTRPIDYQCFGSWRDVPQVG